MAFNIGLDYLVGTIPFIGDAFDFFWKSNKQNMDLIRERATGKDAAQRRIICLSLGLSCF